MTRPKILDEAAEELSAVAAYLEEQRPGYGRRFLLNYQQKLQQMIRFPESAPLVNDMPEAYEIRSFALLQFRCSIIVARVEGVQVIVAVAHQSRKPAYWLDRLQEAHDD